MFQLVLILGYIKVSFSVILSQWKFIFIFYNWRKPILYICNTTLNTLMVFKRFNISKEEFIELQHFYLKLLNCYFNHVLFFLTLKKILRKLSIRNIVKSINTFNFKIKNSRRHKNSSVTVTVPLATSPQQPDVLNIWHLTCMCHHVTRLL